MKPAIIGALAICSLQLFAIAHAGLSAEVTIESTLFPQRGVWQNSSKHRTSLALKGAYVSTWNNDRNVFTFEPFLRLDESDDQRSHLDIRELSYVTSMNSLELRLGISKVFWGVTESVHLVDVINQTDSVENIDGESKLGQPMINATWVTDLGNFDAFVLPYFRERTFAGSDGRFRGSQVVDTDNAQYTHRREEKHMDYAARWSGYRGDLEWGVSYFKGTSREPALIWDEPSERLVPVYDQIDQFGFELQHIYGSLLSKLELRHKHTAAGGNEVASAAGFEYTFYGVGGNADVGALYELLYDGANNAAGSGTDNASFIGTRIALNDEASTEALLGAIIDNHRGRLAVFRLEASRRINSKFSIELEANLIMSPPENSFLNQISKDDYINLRFNFYF